MGSVNLALQIRHLGLALEISMGLQAECTIIGLHMIKTLTLAYVFQKDIVDLLPQACFLRFWIANHNKIPLNFVSRENRRDKSNSGVSRMPQIYLEQKL